MAAMSTALIEFRSERDSRTSTLTGHTAVKPKLVIEKRRVPEGDASVNEYSMKVVFGTANAEGLVLTQKDSFEVIHRSPVLGDVSDVAAALVVFRDIIAGDEFAASINTLNFLKP